MKKKICHYATEFFSVNFTHVLQFSTLVVITAVFASTAFSRELTLAWDANTEANLAGYKIHYKSGDAGGPYDHVVTVPLDELLDPDHPEYTLPDLDDEESYYFSATAYTTNALGENKESVFSNVVGDCGQFEPIRIDIGASYIYPDDNEIQSVYNNYAEDGDVIELQAYEFPEIVDLDRDISIAIIGGFDCEHTNFFGASVVEGGMIIREGDGLLQNMLIDGGMIISGGKVTLQNVMIR